MEGLSRSLAASYAHLNIRSNVIAPGLVESKLAEPILRTEQGRKHSCNMHALKRLGQPQSIAKAIHWLLDSDNDWVTGEVIRIDGGLSTLKVKP